MKSISLIRTYAAIGLAMAAIVSSTAYADDFDCFPLCDQQKSANAATPTSCSTISAANVAIDKIENVNNKLKPIKEIVGYIQSPQSLALKLVNDHVVKIPSWVGYAIDPIGAIKNKAIGEVRERTKTVLKTEFAKSSAVGCEATTAAPSDNTI